MSTPSPLKLNLLCSGLTFCRANSRRIPLPQKSSLYDEIRERGNRIIHLPHVSSMIKKTTPRFFLHFLSNVDDYYEICRQVVDREQGQ